MRIIQSLYLKDGLKSKCGWLSAEFNWMSWALSCLQFTKLYGAVELYTNKAGKEILIDRLGLPYKKVHVVLDQCDNYPQSFWALPKIITYSLQTTPFIHVDGDVYMWEKFTEKILKSNLCAQNIEADTGSYTIINSEIKQHNFWMPQVIQQYEKEGKKTYGYNAGIFGGSDIDFFKRYSALALEMVEKNIDKHASVKDYLGFNVIFEQYLFFCMVKQEEKNVATYFDEEIEDGQYCSMANFIDVPFQNKFIHMLGSYKRNEEACLLLAKRLRLEYPDYYYRIIEECKKDAVEIKLSFYSSIPPEIEETPFSKTLFFLNLEEKANGLHPIFIDLEARINNLKGIANQERIAEVFNYEKALMTIDPFLKNEASYHHEKKQMIDYNRCFKEENQLDNVRFIKNSEASYFDVSNNWVSKVWVADDKSGYQSGNFKIAVIHEPLTCLRKEVFIDELDVIIHDILSSAQSLGQLKDRLVMYFDPMEIKTEPEAFHKLVTLKLKHGIQNGLIHIAA